MIVKCVLAYPTESAKEMGRRFQQGVTWPDVMTVRGPYYFRFLNEGLRALTIFEFDDEHAGPALAAIRRYPQRYLGVSGFTYIVNVGLAAEEFMNFVGLDQGASQ